IHSPKAQTHVLQNGKRILPAIDQMREDVTGIIETADALQGAPDARKRGEETEKVGVVRIALVGVAPVAGV
ncbi:hypothetical protein BDY21DRAFT_289475, partial [Lineolata rhizophorae]